MCADLKAPGAKVILLFDGNLRSSTFLVGDLQIVFFISEYFGLSSMFCVLPHFFKKIESTCILSPVKYRLTEFS